VTRSEASIVGRWIHVHEEDDAEHRVFRRVGIALPLSRGRVELDIAADMTAVRVGPGADDRLAAGQTFRIAFADDAPPEGDAPTLHVDGFSSEYLKILKR
jgi:hypothetical protein